MTSIFIHVYLFFSTRKRLFYIGFSLLFIVLFLLATQVRLQEDISAMVSEENKSVGVEDVLTKIKFADKLILIISSDQTNTTSEPERLTKFASELCDSLVTRFDSTFIQGSVGKVNESDMAAIVDSLYSNLPLYLDEKDYTHLESLLTPTFIRSAISNDYNGLMTPAGFAMKKMILRDPLGLTSLALRKMKSLQVSDQFDLLDGYVMTKDHHNLLLFITPANPGTETKRNQKLLNGIENLAKTINKKFNDEIKVQPFGVIAYATENAKQIKKDIVFTLIVAFTLIFLLLGWYFRSWRIPIFGLLPAIFGGTFALAVIYLFNGSVSYISLGIGAVILGLIVDYALYMINHYRKRGDMVLVIQEMASTIMLCSITTAGAFFCMFFLRSKVLHDLGWFAGLSALGAALFALIFLPQLLRLKDIKRDNRSNDFFSRFASFAFEKRPVIIVLIVLSLIGATFLVKRVNFEKDMMSLNFVPKPLQETEKAFTEMSGGSVNFVYLVSYGNNLNEALKSSEQVESKLRRLGGSGIVVSTSGCGQLLISDSMQEIKIARWEKFWTPEKINKLRSNLRLVSKEVGFKEEAFDSFIQFLSKDFIPVDPMKLNAGPIRGILSDYFYESTSLTLVTTLLKVRPENKEQLYKTFESSQNLVIFDKQLLTRNLIENVRHDFELLVKYSMLFVSFLLLLSFGRIETGLTAAMPMFAAWLLSLGFMGATGIRFNIFNIIVSSFVFGLGVDYSILMMRGLLFDYKYGTHDISTYKTSITLSSLTTLFGVGALFFAKHPALHSIAAISVFGIIAVVFISFTLQPLLTNWFLVNRRNSGQHPVTLYIFIRTFITWGSIVVVAIIQVLIGGLIYLLTPVSRRRKEFLFHWLFSKLCKLYIITTFPINRKYDNLHKEKFNKPAVIISNHQSLIDTPLFLQLHPKIIILTTNWVWNSPLFGPVARMASFYNADKGIDELIEPLKKKVNEGYSILIFPEAHRYNDDEIHRFHRGAFYLAEKLEIDLLPIVIFGSGNFLKRAQFFGRASGLRMNILKRVSHDDVTMGRGYIERSKTFRKLYIAEYSNLYKREGTGRYFRNKLLLTYLFKGNMIEWTLYKTLVAEKNLQIYNQLLPRRGVIVELGCDYGFRSYMLMYTSPERKIIAVENDRNKVLVAMNCFSKSDKIDFVLGDPSTFEFNHVDGVIISNQISIIGEEECEKLIDRCLKSVNPEGIVVLREEKKDLPSFEMMIAAFKGKGVNTEYLTPIEYGSCIGVFKMG